MILGCGIDIVDIARFNHWHTKPITQLKRCFSDEELSYCLEIPSKSAERFATRFAAKEAFYKAFCVWQHDRTYSLMTICNTVYVVKYAHSMPQLKVNWHELNVESEPICHVTLSHAKKCAVAYVLLEQNKESHV